VATSKGEEEEKGVSYECQWTMRRANKCTAFFSGNLNEKVT